MTDTYKALWTSNPFINHRMSVNFGTYKNIYERQLSEIADLILVNDIAPNIAFEEIDTHASHKFNWINKGELVAGSFITNLFNASISSNDIDIYFHSIDDAKLFLKANNMSSDSLEDVHGVMCCTASLPSTWKPINLIWGISYDNARDLIAGFDIRACAMAYDPNARKFTLVKDAVTDADCRSIVFQTSARNVTIARLVKYISKGFTIDKHQRVIMAELIKIKHNIELELNTGQYK